MLKQFFVFLLFLLVIISPIYAAQVSITANISKNISVFDYVFNFSENNSYSSFSFEKPKDAKLIYARESNKSIPYSMAGDYFIFRPEITNGKVFDIRFTSVSKSTETNKKDTFSVYAGFNFPVKVLSYRVNFENNFGEMIDVFPREYEIVNHNSITWTVANVTKDALFLVNFEPNNNATSPVQSKKEYFLSHLLEFSIGFFVFLFLVLLLVLKRYRIFFRKKNFEGNFDKTNSLSVSEEEVVDGGKFEEITQKYLTDNEKEVVDVVNENKGISQYDILNFLPSMTKSNLSKIVSKLHSKKILNRIRVGKVNKIYLGEKFEKSKNTQREPKIDDED